LINYYKILFRLTSRVDISLDVLSATYYLQSLDLDGAKSTQLQLARCL